MTAARILDRVQFGYGKAASKLGTNHTAYRPSAPLTPVLAPQNRLRDLPFVTSATPGADFKRPGKIGDAVSFGLLDVRGAGGAAIRVGDYVTGSTGIYFAASLENLAIPMMVKCNATIIIVRGAGNTAAGIQPYGGRRTSTDVPLMTGWPASVLTGGKQEAGRADLPGDVSMKGYTVLLPAWPGVTLRTSDRIVSSTGEVMTISQAELTDLGWRLSCTLSEV